MVNKMPNHHIILKCIIFTIALRVDFFMGQMHLSKSEPGGDHAPVKFSLHERQGDRSACEFKHFQSLKLNFLHKDKIK